jgi:excisionase family DNA binding protein
VGYAVTVQQAAAALGISASRVYQLIEDGSLEAERAGRTWLVDGLSVERRREVPVPAGRPRCKAADALAGTPARYILMNRTHEVLAFTYVPEAGRFASIDAVLDRDRLPLGIASARSGKASLAALSYWWAHRAIPQSRLGLAERLRELGVSQPEQLPFRSLGLSLSDQYWVRPEGSGLRWEDVNFFQNDFDLGRDGWLEAVGLDSPDNTSEGELPKRWTVEGGRRVLLKGAGPLGQEPYNELVATRLFGRLLAPGTFVPYEVRATDRGPASACPCFLRDTEEYIPAFYVRQTKPQPNHHSDFQHLVECYARLGVTDARERLSQMIVCDDLLGNFDRHLRNFGVVRDVETLACRVAPLFDSGSCLWCNRPTEELRAGRRIFSTKPFYEDANRQLRLVDDYGWFCRDRLDGFVEEAVEVLSADATIADRLPYIADGIQWRIDRLDVLLG